MSACRVTTASCRLGQGLCRRSAAGLHNRQALSAVLDVAERPPGRLRQVPGQNVRLEVFRRVPLSAASAAAAAELSEPCLWRLGQG
jgi:hypothetical protein